MNGPASVSSDCARRAPSCLALAVVLLAVPAARAWHPAQEANFYGFVSYCADEGSPFDCGASGNVLDDAFRVIRGTGAGWAQAEGALTFSTAAAWGLIQPESLEEFDWSSLAWVERADAAGLNVLLNVSAGHDDPDRFAYSPWVDCGGAEVEGSALRCPPRDYQEWYDFGFALAQHFDGQRGAPEVRAYMSVGESDDAASYWKASKEKLYGGAETLVLQRGGGLGSIELPAAHIPVLYQALHDGNPRAFLVVGASSAWRGDAGSLLDEMVQSGASEADVVAQTREFGLSASYAEVIDCLAGGACPKGFGAAPGAVRRSIEFFRYGLLHSRFYDVYAVHYYAPGGYLDAMRHVVRKLAEAGIDKPVWNTGEGLAFIGVPAEVAQRRSAYVHLRRIVESHALEFAWHDVSFLVDFVLTGPNGLYTLPSGGVDYPARRPLAGTFRFLTAVLPTASSSTPVLAQAPFADTRLFAFEVRNPRGSGRLAAGWCRDECPANVLGWCNADCPKQADLAPVLGIAQDEARAAFDAFGALTSASCSGAAVPAIFDEAPFLLAWGPDADGDCVPDIADNCPRTPNPDQLESAIEGFAGAGNPAILAPDALGDACDPEPEATDLEPPVLARGPAPRWGLAALLLAACCLLDVRRRAARRP